MMKILLISPIPPPAGGIASWTNLYLESKRAKENYVDLVSTAVLGERINNFTKLKPNEELRRLIKVLYMLKKKLSEQEFDIVHLNSPCSKLGLLRDYLCAIIVNQKKVKFIVHYRCDVTYMLKGWIQRLLFKKLCKRSDKILVLNKVSKDYVLSKVKKESIIIPNFVEELSIEETISFNVNEELKNILFVGHIIRTKGCYEILKVAEHFTEKNFILVGHITEEFRNICIPKNVRFVGEVGKEEVKQFMLRSDIFLFPTYTEGFPNVVTEAMALGLPIIASAVGAIPDMIEDKGGILVEVGNLNQLVDAINILEHKEIREKISKWNIDKVKQTYTIDKVMENLFCEYVN